MGRTPKWRIVVFASLVLGGTLFVPTVRATPGSGFSASTLALGRFGGFAVKNEASSNEFGQFPVNPWSSKQKTEGESDLFVQSNVWLPDGHTGWHTHPGHSLIIVTAGTITVYDGDDPSCAGRVYGIGQGFVDEGGSHVHLIANEGDVEARTIAVQLIPAGAGGSRRLDAAAPAACSPP